MIKCIFENELHILKYMKETNKRKVKTYAFYILLTQAVGGLSAVLTKNGVENFKAVPKSILTPPDKVFPIAWSILYLLMALGAARVSLSNSLNKDNALSLYYIQLAINFTWSIIFFNAADYMFSLILIIMLLFMIIAMALSFAKSDKAAALLQIPYILWVSFASYLTYCVYVLNK